MQISEQPTSIGRYFDPIAYMRRMESVGFTRVQAEAMAEEQTKLIDERLATKMDIEQLRSDTGRDIALVRKDIEQLRSDTQKDIEAVRRDIEQLRSDTKRDIEQLRSDTKRDIEQSRLSTEAKIAQSQAETIKWVIGVSFAQAGVILAVLRFL